MVTIVGPTIATLFAMVRLDESKVPRRKMERPNARAPVNAVRAPGPSGAGARTVRNRGTCRYLRRSVSSCKKKNGWKWYPVRLARAGTTAYGWTRKR